MAVRRPAVTLYLDPLSRHMENDRLFDPDATPHGGDSILAPYAHLRRWLAERGVATHTGDLVGREGVRRSEVSLYATMGLRTRWRALSGRGDVVLSAFLVNECPVVEPMLYESLPDAANSFRRMYSFAGDEAMRRFLRKPVAFVPFRFPYPFDDVHAEAWSRRERGFLTIINANKVPRLKTAELYRERLRAVDSFERHGEIDLYGIGWEGPPFRVGDTRVPRRLRHLGYRLERQRDRLQPDRDPLLAAARRAWRGAVTSKAETLSRYTFAICFENMVMEGWVTEKIFDCLAAGTVPIYLGAPDIERWVDPSCFVDMRRFGDYAELRAFLHALAPADVETMREAGRESFRSERFQPFRKQAFAELFGRIVAEDAGVDL